MAGILRTAGLSVEVHDDHFPQDALDPEWLRAVGERNWVVVTRDERIRYNVAEKQAIRRAKVRAFVLAAQGNLRAEMLAKIFLKCAAQGSRDRGETSSAVYRQNLARRQSWIAGDLISFVTSKSRTSIVSGLRCMS